MSGVTEVIDRMRRPEYTGENRCLPCTTINLAISVALSALLWILWLPMAGIAAFSVSILVIYLRGYVVPGTPTLTRRYMPIWALELFGKHPDRGMRGAIGVSNEASRRNADPGDAPNGSSAGTSVRDPNDASAEGPDTQSEVPNDGGASTATDLDEDPETLGEAQSPVFVENFQSFLFDAGIVRECEDSNDLCLTDSFQRAWQERLADLVESEVAQLERLAAMLETTPESVEIDEAGDAILVEQDGEIVGNWISRSAFAADVAAEAVLKERIEGWTRIDVRQRSGMLSTLRGFLATCPLCGGDVTLEVVEIGEQDPEACCFSPEIYTARCSECEERFVEIEEMG